MRIANMTITAVLLLGSVLAQAETPVQQVHQDNQDIHQLNKDISNNEADRSKDRDVYQDQRADLNRDRLDRNADEKRELQDLSKGDTKGAAYWNKQRLYQNSRIGTEKKDLSHTRKDLKADNARISKDVKVRHNDVVKRNKAASHI